MESMLLHSNVQSKNPPNIKLNRPLSLSLSLSLVFAKSHSIPRKVLLILCAQEPNPTPAAEMENEAKKEVFKKYLESTGVLDALTKVLVALYEQNNKPSSAIEFIQKKLGGPTVSEYEKLQAEMTDLQVKHSQQQTEMSDLKLKYDKLLTAHQETCSELDELKRSHHASSSKEASSKVEQ